ncbi:tumor necrosis factor receptor superfamily member 10A-like [Mustelus asterias]
MWLISALLPVCLVVFQGLPAQTKHVTAGLPEVTPSSAREALAWEEDQGQQVRKGLTKGNRTIRYIHCREGYYLHGPLLCCRTCPAGTHVTEHCKENFTSSKCKGCTEGEDFTQWPNGLDECLACRSCRQDEERVSHCTRQNDTVCECEAGRFCLPHQSCEMCQKCKTCPEGQTVQKKCSRISDTVCGIEDSTTGGLSSASVAAIVVVLSVLLLCVTPIICYKTTGCTNQFQKIRQMVFIRLRQSKPAGLGDGAVEEEHHPVDVESGGDVERTDNEVNETRNESEALLRNSPDASAGRCVETSVPSPLRTIFNPLGPPEAADPSDPDKTMEKPQPFQMIEEFPDTEGLQQSFPSFVNAVPIGRWKEFMRHLYLTENQIMEAERNNVNDVKEGHYQMLQTWLQKMGNKASITVLLRTLDEMDLVTAANEISSSILNNKTKEH